jgi:membrane-associated phospholipid phosphatase
MKKVFICLVFLVFLWPKLYSDTGDLQPVLPGYPIKLMFHNIGMNALHSITYNYGLNFILAGVETWVFVETGLDWKWRNIAYNNKWLSNCGRPELYIGYVIPAVAPVITYMTGRYINDKKLQITGLALAQTLLLTLAVQTPLKMITDRTLPGIVTELDHTKNTRTDDFSGEFNWFNYNFIGGWPSAHVTNAFAAAAAISEIYSDNIWLNIGVYFYAALMGIGVTLDVHWASEAVAGALIGYAIGKTVGKSFKQLLCEKNNANNLSFYITQNTIGVIIRI